MSNVSVTPHTVLEYAVGGRHGLLEVRTRDIGATIGTEILDDEGQRIVTYKPGTRYTDRAEALAAEHVREALDRIAADEESQYSFLSDLIRVHLCDVVAGEQKWNPDEEDDQW